MKREDCTGQKSADELRPWEIMIAQYAEESYDPIWSGILS